MAPAVAPSEGPRPAEAVPRSEAGPPTETGPPTEATPSNEATPPCATAPPREATASEASSPPRPASTEPLSSQETTPPDEASAPRKTAPPPKAASPATAVPPGDAPSPDKVAAFSPVSVMATVLPVLPLSRASSASLPRPTRHTKPRGSSLEYAGDSGTRPDRRPAPRPQCYQPGTSHRVTGHFKILGMENRRWGSRQGDCRQRTTAGNASATALSWPSADPALGESCQRT